MQNKPQSHLRRGSISAPDLELSHDWWLVAESEAFRQAAAPGGGGGKTDRGGVKESAVSATYSCCYHAPCYYGVCDWATWGRAGRRPARGPSVAARCRAPGHRRRLGPLPPAAERPIYVCYLATITQPTHKSWRGGVSQEETHGTLPSSSTGRPGSPTTPPF